MSMYGRILFRGLSTQQKYKNINFRTNEFFFYLYAMTHLNIFITQVSKCLNKITNRFHQNSAHIDMVIIQI